MRAIWIFAILISQGIFAQDEKPVIAPSLQALAKVEIPPSIEINPLAGNYNWRRDARREEIMKDIVTRENYWDCQGRELPPDAFRAVNTESAYRIMTR